jgi:hypothetical protein
MQRIMQNTCLINAILKQHIIPGTAQHHLNWLGQIYCII